MSDDISIVLESSDEQIYVTIDDSVYAITTWGQIFGTLADQVDLQAALDAKVDDTEVATTATPNKLLKLNDSSLLPASITGNAATATEVAWGGVSGKPSTYPPSSHSTGSHSDWPSTVSMTEVGCLSGVTSDIQTQLNGKAAAATGVTNGDSHDHVGGDGAAITEGALSFSDVTTNNVSNTKHGLMPKSYANSVVLTDASGNVGYLSSTTGRALVSIGGGGMPTFGYVALSGPTIGVGGTLGISNGGTGSSTQNFVDLTTDQTIAGNKTFSGNTTLGDSTADTVTIAGTQLNYAGTAAAPSIAFTGDTNTGIYSPAVGTIGIATGGVERLKVDNLGTVTANTRLNVGSNIIMSAAANQITVKGTSSGYIVGRRDTGANAFMLYSDTGSLQFYNYNTLSESARITSDGRLLVGATSATYDPTVYITTASRAQALVTNFNSTTSGTKYNTFVLSLFTESDNTNVTTASMFIQNRCTVPSTITKTGGHATGVLINNLRNYVVVAANDDSGTGYDLRGITVQTGHFNSNSAETPISTLVRGIHIQPYAATGTIGSMYGLFIATQSGSATVTDKWGVYQQDANYKNYFAGNLLIGTTTNPGYGAKIHSTAGISLGNSAVADGRVLDWYEEGTFTATATGMTTSPTGTVKYTRVGNVVTLDIPSITGTSNATTFTLTGMPAQLRPAATKAILVRLQDNGGVYKAAVAAIDSAGLISLGNGMSTADLFTSSGTKSIATVSASYTLQ